MVNPYMYKMRFYGYNRDHIHTSYTYTIYIYFNTYTTLFTYKRCPI